MHLLYPMNQSTCSVVSHLLLELIQESVLFTLHGLLLLLLLIHLASLHVQLHLVNELLGILVNVDVVASLQGILDHLLSQTHPHELLLELRHRLSDSLYIGLLVDFRHDVACFLEHLGHFDVGQEPVNLVLHVLDLGLVDIIPVNVLAALEQLSGIGLLGKVVRFGTLHDLLFELLLDLPLAPFHLENLPVQFPSLLVQFLFHFPLLNLQLIIRQLPKAPLFHPSII